MPRTSRMRYAMSITLGYFTSRDRAAAIALLIACIGLRYGGVHVALAQNSFERRLFDALQDRTRGVLTPMIAYSVFLAVMVAAVTIANKFLYDTLSIRWRQWLTDRTTRRWLNAGRFQAIERDSLVDNPDQRIAEDIDLFIQGAMQLSLGLATAAFSLVGYTRVLWRMSSPIRLSAFGTALAIPGDMVVYAYLYEGIGSWIIMLFGRVMIRRTMQLQHYEADFRTRLVQVRKHAEQVLLMGLAALEASRLVTAMAAVRRRFMSLLFVQTGVTAASELYSVCADILPLIVVLPRYMAGRMTMGTMFQIRGAFGALNATLSWFIQAYPQIATTGAALERLRQLDHAIETPVSSGITLTFSGPDMARVQALGLTLPGGKPLLDIAQWSVGAGERWAITGPSGTGKSTLLRALNGIWPDGTGRIDMPAHGVMTLPQTPYLAPGALRAMLASPAAADSLPAATCAAALRDVRLDGLVARLDEARDWQAILSPGEQQRIGFARVLLHRPRLLLADEATAALDPPTARAMYDLLLTLPAMTLISVIHASDLLGFHTHELAVSGGQGRPGPRPDHVRAPDFPR